MIVACLIIGIVGIVVIVMGYLLWRKERISLLHDYHYDKVSEANKKIFCTISGIGLVVLGCGFLLTAVVLGITTSVWSYLVMTVGFVIGISLLIYAGRKYNR